MQLLAYLLNYYLESFVRYLSYLQNFRVNCRQYSTDNFHDFVDYKNCSVMSDESRRSLLNDFHGTVRKSLCCVWNFVQQSPKLNYFFQYFPWMPKIFQNAGVEFVGTVFGKFCYFHLTGQSLTWSIYLFQRFLLIHKLKLYKL